MKYEKKNSNIYIVYVTILFSICMSMHFSNEAYRLDMLSHVILIYINSDLVILYHPILDKTSNFNNYISSL